VILPTSTSPKCQCADHLFIIFAVLDVSFAVNSCINSGFYIICSFITFLQLLRGTGYMVSGPHNFWGAPVDQQVPTKFGTKAVIVTYCQNPRCVPNLKLLPSVVTEISSPIFEIIPSPAPLPILVLNVVLVSYSPNPSSVPNLKLPASTVAEISKESQNFLDASLALTFANFGPKCCFLVRYSPNPTCKPNCKLLASTVAKISRGPKIFRMLPYPAPCQFWF